MNDVIRINSFERQLASIKAQLKMNDQRIRELEERVRETARSKGFVLQGVELVPAGLELRSDNGPQYRGSVCFDLSLEWNFEQSFTLVGQPTGNAITERVILTMKTEVIWAQDWESAEELRQALEAWRHRYNHRRPHEALG